MDFSVLESKIVGTFAKPPTVPVPSKSTYRYNSVYLLASNVTGLLPTLFPKSFHSKLLFRTLLTIILYLTFVYFYNYNILIKRKGV